MIRRVILLTGLLVATLFGPSQLGHLVEAGEPDELRDVEVAAPAAGDGDARDVEDAVVQLRRTTEKLLAMQHAADELADAELRAETGRVRIAVLRARYDRYRAVWLILLVAVPTVWVLVGFAGVFASLAFVGRKLGEAGMTVARTWLGVIALGGPVATLLGGELAWAYVPLELYVSPILWLVGCAWMLKTIDANAPVWNTTLATLIALVGGLLASVAALAVDPFGVARRSAA